MDLHADSHKTIRVSPDFAYVVTFNIAALIVKFSASITVSYKIAILVVFEALLK